MKIKCNKRRFVKASFDYADLKGVDFRKAKDILTKDGFSEHEYGDKDDNNGYAVYRKGNKEVELQYQWNKGKRKDEYHAGKVTNVYVDEDINSSTKPRFHKSVKASRCKAPRRRSKVMAGPGAGYTIDWDLERINKINSFDVVNVSKPGNIGDVEVTADCDVDLLVTINSAWSYMYGFNTPIEGVSAKLTRIVFNYNILDNYEDISDLDPDNYEDGVDDPAFIDEVINAVYQINEMEAMTILEDDMGADAWDTIRGAEFTYGGGYVHSTWDGTLLEVDEHNYADIQVTDSAVVEYVDRAVSGETVYSNYTVFINGDATGYNYETEEEAINEAKAYIESGEYEGDIADTYVERTDWVEYFNGDTDFVDSEIVWNAFDEYEND